MRTDSLDYNLPEKLIAQAPAVPRDSSRLLLCPRSEGAFLVHVFRNLPDLLRPGDLLVTNAARVMPARLLGYKHPSGARIEILLLERLPNLHPSGARFKALLKRKRRLEVGNRVLLPESRMYAEVTESEEAGCEHFPSPEAPGTSVVELAGVDDIEDEIDRIGRIPLPPYIKRYSGDLGLYQTVFARVPGSVAAPTAGLHFTPDLLKRLENREIDRVEVHLRVGWGTFSPIRSELLEDHELHAENGELPEETADRINARRKAGGRIVAVGTTVTRLLETASDPDGLVRPFKGKTDLYITPGYEFKAVDVLLTNFHLPRTSLLALVAAFMGVERTLAAYDLAIRQRFRFYSFGDAMLIL